MFSTVYLRLEGNVPHSSQIEIFFKHECCRFLSILVMGDLTPATSLPTDISSLSKTVKRKPLIFNFKWNFGWILGQHDILVLGDVPPPTKSEKNFLSKVRFELANVPPPPHQGLKKKIFKKLNAHFGIMFKF